MTSSLSSAPHADNLMLAAVALNVQPITVLVRAARRVGLKQVAVIADERWQQYRQNGYDALPPYVRRYCHEVLHTPTELFN